MRDIFSGFAYVRRYVLTWRSRLGMSICAHAQESGLTETCITRGRRSRRGGRFLAMEDREDSAAGPSQRTYLAESSAETSAERSQQLVTLTKKGKRSLHRRSQESKKRTKKKKFKSRKHILESLHKPGIVFGSH